MRRIVSLFAVTLALLAGTGCGIEKTSTPDGFSGPSEFGTALTMTASPELLPRDGRSQSVIALTLRGTDGNPLTNRGVRVFVDVGQLSASEVTTGSNGVATVIYTAPGVNSGADLAVISATPAGSDWATAVPRHVHIALVGSSLPIPDFSWTPVSPARFALTSFDASATTVGGTRCGSACTYSWDFSGEATATGQFVTYRFQNEGTYRVTLTVTAPGGTSETKSYNVTVVAGVKPTAVIRFSPTSPCINQTVFFNATESTGANGAQIEEYEWDFGNGTTLTTGSSQASASYTSSGAHTVVLTVIDSNGQRGSATTAISVRLPTAPATTCP